MYRNRSGIGLALLVIYCCLWTGSAFGQPVVNTEDYRLGVGDVLQLNVLQQPDLDRELTVQPDGTAFIPLVGETSLAGLTVAEAEQVIRNRLELFNPNIDAVTLSIVQYNALRIFVLGAVANPGPYTFTTSPSLWDAMRAAGGPTESANLNAVRLVRQQETGVMTQTVNLSSLLSGGTEFPAINLRGGDTLIIPNSLEAAAMIAPSDGVQIFGAVAQPSVVPLLGPTRLLTCLMMAGAPLNNAELNKIFWVHNAPDEGRYRSTLVNLDIFIEEGKLAGNPLVYPGDTLSVPAHEPGWVSRNLPLILTTLATFGTVYLIYVDANR